MNTKTSRYWHPRHDEILMQVSEGLSDKAVARTLGVDRKAVARVRLIEGIRPVNQPLTADETLARHTKCDDRGHTLWTGSRSYHGVPQIWSREASDYRPASHFVFERHYGSEPVGRVQATCDTLHCLTGSHLMDEHGRRDIGLWNRSIMGLRSPWKTCRRCGGDWARVGRVAPDLKLYCSDCNTDRNRRNRRNRKDTTS